MTEKGKHTRCPFQKEKNNCKINEKTKQDKYAHILIRMV